MMPAYHIGTLDRASLEALKTDSITASNEPAPEFLNPRTWSKTTLIEKRPISQDTRIFKFQLEHKNQALGLPIGQHLMIKLPDHTTNEPIIRAYTPISDPSVEGTMDLLVKIYPATGTSPGGQMTTVLDRIPLGTSIDCKGPIGRFHYLGNGRVLVNGKERKIRSFRMICGGTGITPIFQVLRAVMQDRQDPTSCVVLDSNRSEEDILCRSELDSFMEADRRKCSIVHTLTDRSEGWMGHRGRISGELLREYVPVGNDSMVLVCGPEGLEKNVRGILLKQGWAESDIHIF